MGQDTKSSGAEKTPPSKNLPSMDSNFFLHTLKTHLQLQFWKTADKDDRPAAAAEISNCGWEVTQEGAVIPSIWNMKSAQLLDIISCSCHAEGKAYSQNNCSCKSVGLSCPYCCVCEGGENCCSPVLRMVMEMKRSVLKEARRQVMERIRRCLLIVVSVQLNIIECEHYPTTQRGVCSGVIICSWWRRNSVHSMTLDVMDFLLCVSLCTQCIDAWTSVILLLDLMNHNKHVGLGCYKFR